MRQLLVEIQDDVLERMRNGEYVIYDLVGAVMNGTPLPEHHGRLIDADVLENKLNEVFKAVGEVPTIIPATKESDGE